MPIISKITAKGRTTVPKEIRAALDGKPGDLIAWEVDPDGRVGVRRIQPADVENLQAIQSTLSEWHAVEDGQACQPVPPVSNSRNFWCRCSSILTLGRNGICDGRSIRCPSKPCNPCFSIGPSLSSMTSRRISIR